MDVLVFTGGLTRTSESKAHYLINQQVLASYNDQGTKPNSLWISKNPPSNPTARSAMLLLKVVRDTSMTNPSSHKEGMPQPEIKAKRIVQTYIFISML